MWGYHDGKLEKQHTNLDTLGYVLNWAGSQVLQQDRGVQEDCSSIWTLWALIHRVDPPNICHHDLEGYGM